MAAVPEPGLELAPTEKAGTVAETAGPADGPDGQPRIQAPAVLGQVLGGKYRVLQALGHGGMGAVYEAEQLGLGRRVAIKMLHSEYAARSDAALRFEREARLAASIGHENIVAVHDIGKTERGELYMVMERLEGCSLRHLLERERVLPGQRVHHVVDQILAALQAAHDKRIVHRDIKPENVFVCPAEGGRERIKVLDFGISKMLPTDDGGALHLTRTGTMMGTPLYMSPEQAMGQSDLDLRVDTYAVGVLLFRALTGRHPHEASNFNALVASLITRDAPSMDTVAPGLHPAWVSLVGRALARDRDRRFQTAAQMRQALRALPTEALGEVAVQPVSSPATVPAAGWSTTRKHPFRGTVALALALLVAGVISAGWWWSSSTSQRPPASSGPSSVPTKRVALGPTEPAATAAAPTVTVPAATAPSLTAAMAAVGPADAGASAPLPATIRVRIRVDPATAAVRLDGQVHTNPVDLQLPRSSEPLRVEASAPGHLPQTQLLGRGSDIDVAIPLAAAAGPAAGAGQRGGRRPRRMRETLE
jgi:serine/threonine-protein kinase